MANIHIQNKRTAAVAALAMLFIVAAAIVMIKMIPSSDNEEPLPSIDDTQSAARTFADNNDIDGGLKYYEDQINARASSDEKKTLLLYKSEFAQSMGRPDKAFEAAQQADAISSDAATSEMLAQAYEAQGNKEQALVYYKKALELSPKEGLGSRYNSVLEDTIKRLEQ